MYRLTNRCRACDHDKLTKVFSLGVQPLANDFCKDGEDRHGHAPLEVLFCKRCTLAQLSVVVRPDILYSYYRYVTSPSTTMQEHFQRLYAEIIDRQPNPVSFVEIGSNDGAYLRWLRAKGYTVCGIDPAENLKPGDVDSVCGTFSRSTAMLANQKIKGAADVVIARHVFCHVDDWMEFMESMTHITHRDSLIVIEVPYAGKLLAMKEFDTIYHEHTSYLTFKAITALLERTPFVLHDIVDVEIHGGVVVLFIRHKEHALRPNPKAIQRVAAENITERHWQKFSVDAGELMSELRIVVDRCKDNGKSVAALGASAKSTVLFNACGFTEKDIAFVTDTTIFKQGRFVPGTQIPILPPEALLDKMPDVAIMGCWNFRSEVLERNKAYTGRGGKFIVPVPEVEIVP